MNKFGIEVRSGKGTRPSGHRDFRFKTKSCKVSLPHVTPSISCRDPYEDPVMKSAYKRYCNKEEDVCLSELRRLLERSQQA